MASLNVIVVGGGICGLSCAIGLRRSGHNVTVYEKYPKDADAGAGIVVRDSANRILQSWGLDLSTVGAFKYKKRELIDGPSLRILTTGVGADSTMMTTRSDLRSLLRLESERIVEGAGSIRFVYEKKVVDYDAARPAIQLRDGTWEAADLVIACDGIRSKASKIVTGTDSPAKATGSSVFRLVVPDAVIRPGLEQKFADNELLRERLEKDSGIVWFAVENPGKVFVWWTCRFNESQCFDIVIRDNEKYASSEEWLAKCDKQVVLDEFSHWHPIFTEILKIADEPLLWKICDREPLEVLYKDRLCILGDALHPMRPFRAQGGTQSIEDAGVLEVCLAGLKNVEELGQRLQYFQKLRLPRYATAQVASTVMQGDPNAQTRWEEVLQKGRLWHEGLEQSHCKYHQYPVFNLAGESTNVQQCRVLRHSQLG